MTRDLSVTKWESSNIKILIYDDAKTNSLFHGQSSRICYVRYHINPSAGPLYIRNPNSVITGHEDAILPRSARPSACTASITNLYLYPNVDFYSMFFWLSVLWVNFLGIKVTSFNMASEILRNCAALQILRILCLIDSICVSLAMLPR